MKTLLFINFHSFIINNWQGITNLFDKDNIITHIHWLKYKSGKRHNGSRIILKNTVLATGNGS